MEQQAGRDFLTGSVIRELSPLGPSSPSLATRDPAVAPYGLKAWTGSHMKERGEEEERGENAIALQRIEVSVSQGM